MGTNEAVTIPIETPIRTARGVTLRRDRTEDAGSEISGVWLKAGNPP
jgi:hypothetical protein